MRLEVHFTNTKGGKSGRNKEKVKLDWLDQLTARCRDDFTEATLFSRATDAGQWLSTDLTGIKPRGLLSILPSGVENSGLSIHQKEGWTEGREKGKVGLIQLSIHLTQSP